MKINYLPLLCCLASFQTLAVEFIEWTREPISLTLNQHDERMVILDKNISVGLPASLQTKLRVQSVGGVLYFKSSEPFPETRLMLKDVETGEIILLDVIGKGESQQKLETVQIVVGDEVKSTSLDNGIVNESNGLNKNTASTPIPIQLTRYASQSFYAPMRSIEPVPGIRQLSVSLPSKLTLLLPSLPVAAMPLATWRLNGFEVVAIKLTNQSHKRIELDPRLLQGHFYSATFQHTYLGEAGSSSDTTMLYLVVKGKAANAFLSEPSAMTDLQETQ